MYDQLKKKKQEELAGWSTSAPHTFCIVPDMSLCPWS